jgi:hypothetical protein
MNYRLKMLATSAFLGWGLIGPAVAAPSFAPSYCEPKPSPLSGRGISTYIFNAEETSQSSGKGAFQAFLDNCHDGKLHANSVVVIPHSGLKCSGNIGVDCSSSAIEGAVKAGDVDQALRLIRDRMGDAAPQVHHVETVTHTVVAHRGGGYGFVAMYFVGGVLTLILFATFCGWFWSGPVYAPPSGPGYSPNPRQPRPTGPTPAYPSSFGAYPGTWGMYNGVPAWGYYGGGGMFSPWGYYGPGGFVGYAAYDAMLAGELMVGSMIGAEMAMSGAYGWEGGWNDYGYATDSYTETTDTYSSDAGSAPDTGGFSDGGDSGSFSTGDSGGFDSGDSGGQSDSGGFGGNDC